MGIERTNPDSVRRNGQTGEYNLKNSAAGIIAGMLDMKDGKMDGFITKKNWSIFANDSSYMTDKTASNPLTNGEQIKIVDAFDEIYDCAMKHSDCNCHEGSTPVAQQWIQELATKLGLNVRDVKAKLQELNIVEADKMSAPGTTTKPTEESGKTNFNADPTADAEKNEKETIDRLTKEYGLSESFVRTYLLDRTMVKKLLSASMAGQKVGIATQNNITVEYFDELLKCDGDLAKIEDAAKAQKAQQEGQSVQDGEDNGATEKTDEERIKDIATTTGLPEEFIKKLAQPEVGTEFDAEQLAQKYNIKQEEADALITAAMEEDPISALEKAAKEIVTTEVVEEEEEESEFTDEEIENLVTTYDFLTKELLEELGNGAEDVDALVSKYNLSNEEARALISAGADYEKIVFVADQIKANRDAAKSNKSGLTQQQKAEIKAQMKLDKILPADFETLPAAQREKALLNAQKAIGQNKDKKVADAQKVRDNAIAPAKQKYDADMKAEVARHEQALKDVDKEYDGYIDKLTEGQNKRLKEIQFLLNPDDRIPGTLANKKKALDEINAGEYDPEEIADRKKRFNIDFDNYETKKTELETEQNQLVQTIEAIKKQVNETGFELDGVTMESRTAKKAAEEETYRVNTEGKVENGDAKDGIKTVYEAAKEGPEAAYADTVKKLGEEHLNRQKLIDHLLGNIERDKNLDNYSNKNQKTTDKQTKADKKAKEKEDKKIKKEAEKTKKANAQQTAAATATSATKVKNDAETSNSEKTAEADKTKEERKAERQQRREEERGFFKRLFGGGKSKAEKHDDD